MGTLIKADTLWDGPGLGKTIEYFNSDVWIFYAWTDAGNAKISYKLKSEAYAIERTLTPPAGEHLSHVFGVDSDSTYIYVFCKTTESNVMRVIRLSTAYAETLKTTTFTPVTICQIANTTDDNFLIYDGIYAAGASNDAIHYSFTPNTFTILTQPAAPGTTQWAIMHFQPTVFQDKIYFQHMSYLTSGNYGQAWFLYFDIGSSTLGLELFEYSFDAKFEEGYAKVYTFHGMAATNNSLLQMWTIAVGESNTFPTSMADTDYYKVYSFVIIKNLITGQWDQYQQIAEQNWWNGTSFTLAGTTQRGSFVFLKNIDYGSDYTIGANWSMDGSFKNYYKPIINPPVTGAFCIPYHTIPCYVPIVYFVDNTGAFDQYVEEYNFFGVPPKPLYLTDITQWDLYGFRLYANYIGFENPYKMEIDIDTAAGVGVVQREVTTSNTWVETLASDGLAYGQYKWRCRFIDTCNNDGVWSDFTYFWIREKPTFNSVAFDSLVTQRPNLVIDLNDYGCPIDTIEITIDNGVFPLWRSGLLKAALYYDAISDTYIVPIDTHGNIILTTVPINVTTRITNAKGRTNHNHYNPTQVFATVAAPTGVTVTKYNGYMRLSWTAAAAATGYKIYKTIAGVRTYIATTTGLYYDDVACEMNTPIIYGVVSYDAVSQSADVAKTESIITNFYALVCEDFWNVYVLVPTGGQLGQTKDNNMESTGQFSSSKFKTGTANVTFDISQYDFKNFEDRDDLEFYIKVKNEVYHVQISSYSVDRNRNTQAYRINASLIRVFDTDILNDWYMSSEWMET